MENSKLQFMPYAVQMNYKKRIEEILDFTEKENNAIDRYQGNSVMANELLGNYISDQAILLPDIPYYTTKFSNNRETVERLMQEIQDIYSAMAKASINRKRTFRLYRGASRGMDDNKEQSFISTTTDYREGVNWATLNNRDASKHYFIELEVEEGVTLFFMPDKANEQEVLISPFVELEKVSEERGEKDGMPIQRQRVKVKKRELREMSAEEMSALQEEVLADADRMAEQIRECITTQREIKSIKSEIEGCHWNMDRYYKAFATNQLSYEDYKELEQAVREKQEYLENQLQKKEQELKEKNAPLSEWKQKIRRLLEGRCKEVEKGLQRQIDQAMETAIAETNQIAQERFRREQEEAEREKQNADTIRSKIRTVKSLLTNSEGGPGNSNPLQSAIDWRNKFKRFQIPYDSPTDRCLVAISRIDYDCESAHDGILERASQIVELPQKLMDLQRSEESLERVEINEFARSVELLVVGIRVRQEERMLVNAKKNNETQKIGIFGKLIGKEKKQQEVSDTINMQLQQLRDFSHAINFKGLNNTITYSVHDILAEIQIAKSKGGLTEPELAELEKYQTAIMNLFQIRQDRFEKKYNEKTQGNIANYDTNAFISQYSAKITPSQLRNRRITMAETLCSRIGNQIGEDERWQRQREEDKAKTTADRDF